MGNKLSDEQITRYQRNGFVFASVLLLLIVLAGCTGAARSDDGGDRPVFYGGVGGSVYSR